MIRQCNPVTRILQPKPATLTRNPAHRAALKSAKVAATSGNPWIDNAALETASQSRYSLEMQDCTNVGGSYVLSVFMRPQLQDGKDDVRARHGLPVLPANARSRRSNQGALALYLATPSRWALARSASEGPRASKTDSSCCLFSSGYRDSSSHKAPSDGTSWDDRIPERSGGP